MTLQDKSRIVIAVRVHAHAIWKAEEEVIEAIAPTKIDVTMDLGGSFLALDQGAAQQKLL